MDIKNACFAICLFFLAGFTNGCDEVPPLIDPGYIPALTNISVTPSSKSLYVGAIQKFTAKGLDQRGNTFVFTPSWNLERLTGEVTTGGEFAAKAPGTGRVVAYYPASGVAGYASVTVSYTPTVEPITLSSIEVIPKSSSMNVGIINHILPWHMTFQEKSLRFHFIGVSALWLEA